MKNPLAIQLLLFSFSSAQETMKKAIIILSNVSSSVKETRGYRSLNFSLISLIH